MFFQRSSSLLLATIVVVSVVSVDAAADGLEYPGVGTAPVVGGNHVSARRRAISRARQSAVIAVVASTLSPTQLIQHATKLPQIYSRHRAYVRNYRVLSETKQEGKFRVEISCSLDLKRLRMDLQRLVAPKPAAVTSSQPVVSVELKARSRDADLAAHLRKRSEAALRAAGFTAVGKAAATLRIEAVASVAGGVRGLGLAGAKVDLSYAVLLADGPTLVSSQQAAWGVGNNAVTAERLAGERALDAALRAVSAALHKQWPNQSISGRRVVRVSGVESWRQHQQICRVMEGQLPGVQRCRPARLVAGDAWFWLSTTSSATQLAEQLSRQNFNGFSLRVSSTSGGALWLKVVASSP